jgi:hypothetical protein
MGLLTSFLAGFGKIALGGSAFSALGRSALGTRIGLNVDLGGVLAAGGKVLDFGAWLFLLCFAIIGVWLTSFVSGDPILRLLFYIGFYFTYYQFAEQSFKKFRKQIIFFSFLGIFGHFILGLLERLFSFVPFMESFLPAIATIFFFFGYLSPIFRVLGIHHDAGHGFAKFIEVVVLSFIVLIIILSVFDSFKEAVDPIDYGFLGGAVSSQELSAIGRGVNRALEFTFDLKDVIVDSARNIKNTTRNFVNESYNSLTYEEQVDENAGVAALGLSLVDFVFSNQDHKYLQGDAVSAFVTVEAKSLDTPIDVLASCSAIKNKDETVEGRINTPEFSVYDLEIRDLSCSFPKDTFQEKGKSHKVSITTQFNYVTSSYLRRYFMDRDAFSNLRRGDVDPIAHFSISKEDEHSKFTNGPISLALIKNGLLQTLDDSQNSFSLRLGLDVNRKFAGQAGVLRQISSLTFSLPDGLSVGRAPDGTYDCTQSFNLLDTGSCVATCGQNLGCVEDCGTYKIYALNPESIDYVGKNGNIYVSLPFTMSCEIDVDSPRAILGNGPYGIQNFRSQASYTFELTSESAFSVQERKGYIVAENTHDFCGKQFKVRNDIDEVQTGSLEVMQERAEPFVNTLPQDGICPGLLKAIGTWYHRGGSYVGPNFGPLGVTRAKAETVSQKTFTDDELITNQVSLAVEYLNAQLKDECTQGDKVFLDCAVGKLVCNGDNDAACHVSAIPQILALTTMYGGSS